MADPIETTSKRLREGGLVWTLSAIILLLLLYVGVDKIAMSDRWTASNHRAYAAEVKSDIAALDKRLRDVEMKHAELKGKLDSIASSIAGLNQGMGELRALLLEHERRENRDPDGGG